MFKPAIITATPATPVICDGFLPLDGVLFYYACRLLLGEELYTLPKRAADERVKDITLPFERREGNGQWYYACSFAFWHRPVALDKTIMSKRFDVYHAEQRLDFKGRRGKVDLDKGYYKNYFLQDASYHAPAITWFAVCDIEQTKRLLAHVSHVGKKCAHGYGSVLNFDIKETGDDFSEHYDGKPSRALPDPDGQAVYGIRPSYWLPENQCNVLMPSSILEI